MVPPERLDLGASNVAGREELYDVAQDAVAKAADAITKLLVVASWDLSSLDFVFFLLGTISIAGRSCWLGLVSSCEPWTLSL
jgi:hypothetical protein